MGVYETLEDGGTIQSLLFVPGTKPDRFAKALASGADCVCVDLEDAVPAADKDSARAAALSAIAEGQSLALRINGVRTRAGLADLLSLTEATVRPSVLLIPMVEDAAEIAIVRAVLSDSTIALIPLIETVRGLTHAHAIAAERQVTMLMFGGGDFSAELGVALAWEPLLAARAQLVMAAKGAGKGAMDVPFIHMSDADGLAIECAAARDIGFTAKAAIHPAQIEAIHAAFRPSADQIAEAEAALTAYADASGAAIRFNGKLLEAPIIARYRQIIALKGKIHA